MIRAHADLSGKLLERRNSLMRLDEPARLGDFPRVSFVQRRLIRLAPFARPKTRALRILP
jgi:hypothetical protein